MQTIIDYRNEIETFKYGHTSGIRLNYLISRKLSIESGVNYSTFGERMKPRDIYTFNNDTTYLLGTIESRNTYHFISVPVDVNYSFGKSALKYFITSGVSLGYHAGYRNQVRLKYADGGTSDYSSSDFGTPDSFHKIVLNAQLSAGIQYHFNTNLSMRIAPVFRINVTSITDAPIQGHYFNTGIDTGLMWRFSH